MKRPSPREEQARATTGQADETFTVLYPTILTYLLDDKWDDGKAREVSAISFTIKEGNWQLALNDKALKRSFYTTGATLESCLEALEAAQIGRAHV